MSVKYQFYDPHDGYSGAYMPPRLVKIARQYDGKTMTLEGARRAIKKAVGDTLIVEVEKNVVRLATQKFEEWFQQTKEGTAGPLTTWRFLRYKRVSGKKTTKK